MGRILKERMETPRNCATKRKLLEKLVKPLQCLNWWIVMMGIQNKGIKRRTTESKHFHGFQLADWFGPRWLTGSVPRAPYIQQFLYQIFRNDAVICRITWGSNPQFKILLHFLKILLKCLSDPDIWKHARDRLTEVNRNENTEGKLERTGVFSRKAAAEFIHHIIAVSFEKALEIFNSTKHYFICWRKDGSVQIHGRIVAIQDVSWFWRNQCIKTLIQDEIGQWTEFQIKRLII